MFKFLQELDYIKNDNNNTRSQQLKTKARRAIEFLNKHFESRHPRFLGQTVSDVEENREKFSIDCPDDEILQTCLQIQQFEKSVVYHFLHHLLNKTFLTGKFLSIGFNYL